MRATRRSAPRVIAVLALAAGAALIQQPRPIAAAAVDRDPFSVFGPSVVITEADRDRLAKGIDIVRVLPADGTQLSVFAATRLDAPAQVLVRWTRAMPELKRGPNVRLARLFSASPALADLDELSLDDDDLDALRRCVPGDCGLKLDAAGIAALRQAAATAGASWKNAVQRRFREWLLERVRQARQGGLASLTPVVDKAQPVSPAGVGESLVRDLPALERWAPGLAGVFGPGPMGGPAADRGGVDTFFYWSKERYETGKDVISVTQVAMARPEADDGPQVIVASRQIFASHYVSGSAGLTVVIRDRRTGALCLAYLNRTSVDLLGGFLAAVRRAAAEQRIREQAPGLLRQLRTRLEREQPTS